MSVSGFNCRNLQLSQRLQCCGRAVLLHLRALLLPVARQGTFPLGSAPGTAWAVAEADGEFGTAGLPRQCRSRGELCRAGQGRQRRRGRCCAGPGGAGRSVRSGRGSGAAGQGLQLPAYGDSHSHVSQQSFGYCQEQKTKREVPSEGEKVILISEV